MHKPNVHQHGRRAGRVNTGFSLIEVLVAVLVIALGILGTSGLLVAALSASKTAQSRTVAAMQASSLASAIYTQRGFWGNASQSPGFAATGTTVTRQTQMTISEAPNCSSHCSAKQMAEYDVRQWLTSLNQALPGAESDVTCSSSGAASQPQHCVIEIRWRENYVQSGRSVDALDDTAATSGTRKFFLHLNP